MEVVFEEMCDVQGGRLTQRSASSRERIVLWVNNYKQQ